MRRLDSGQPGQAGDAPVNPIGAISGSAYTSGKALRNSPTWPTSSATSPPMSADSCVSPCAGFCPIKRDVSLQGVW